MTTARWRCLIKRALAHAMFVYGISMIHFFGHFADCQRNIRQVAGPSNKPSRYNFFVENKMPRTKQQKPRHIVERENAEGSPPTPTTCSESEDDVMDEERDEAMTYETPPYKDTFDPNSHSGKPTAPRRTAQNINDSEAYAATQLMSGDSGAPRERSFDNDPSDNHKDYHDPSAVSENEVSPPNGVCLPSRNEVESQVAMDAQEQSQLETNLDKSNEDIDELQIVRQNCQSDVGNSVLISNQSVDLSKPEVSNENVQYKVLSAAAAHYMNTVKMLMGGNRTGEGDSNGIPADFWSMWANAAKRSAYPDLSGARNDHMFNMYMTQLSDRWKTIIGQQFDKPKDVKSPAPSNRHIPATLSPKSRGDSYQRTPNGNASFQSFASDSTLSGLQISATQAQTKGIDFRDKSAHVEADRRHHVMGPSSAPEGPTHAQNYTSSTSPHSAPPVVPDRNAWQPAIVSNHPSRSWSSSHAPGFPSPSAGNPINAFNFPSPKNDSTTAQGALKIFENNDGDSSSRLPTPNHTKQGSYSSVSSLSQDGHLLPKTGASGSSNDKSRRQSNDVSPQARPLGDYMYFPESLDDIRKPGMPYPAYSPGWMGVSLPPFGSLSPASVPNSQSQLLFSPHLPFPSGLPSNRQLSPRMSAFSPNSPFMDSFPSTSNKSSTPRRRTRGPPIDSVHAAIVREAKEQFKGLDPENMYIQCPICQKRIKRLYHFQRHMRIHTGEKTHHCPCCQYKSVRKDNLKSHMKTHEKQNIENSRRAGRSFHGGRDPDAIGRNRSQVDLSGGTKPVDEANPNRAISEKATARGSPFKATSDYKASFASSYAPPYPLPYFPQQFHPYVNISPNNQGRPPTGLANTSNLERKHHSLPTTPERSFEKSPILGKVSQSETSSAPIFAFNPTDLELRKLTSPKSLKRGVEQQQPEDMSLKSEDNDNKRQKQNHQETNNAISPITNSNSNHNNSNPTKDGRIFRAWGDIEIPTHSTENKYPNTLPVSMPVTKSEVPNSPGLSRLNGAFGEAPNLASYVDQSWTFTNMSRKGIGGVEERRSHKNSTSSSSMSSEFSPESESRSRESTPKIRATTVTKSPPRLSPGLSGVLPKYNDEICTENTQPEVRGNQTKVQIKLEVPAERSPGVPNYTKSEESKSPSLDGIAAMKELSCRLCPFRATSTNSLQAHMTLTHKQDGFYKCDVCNYLGKNLSKLVEHIRIHTGERPFKCDQCNYAAKRKDNLAQHKAVRHDKRKGKGGGLYTVLDQINQQREMSVPVTRTENMNRNMKENNQAPKSQLFRADFQYNKSDLIADAEKLANNGIPIAPLFHSFPPMHSIPPYMYPFCFPSPLVHGADLAGAMNGPTHPRAVNERPTNPGSYSLKVRAALISP